MVAPSFIPPKNMKQKKFLKLIEKLLKSKEEGHRLLDMMDTTSQVCMYIIITFYAFLTLAVVFLLYVLIKNKVINGLPKDVKIGIAFYAIYAPCGLALFLTIHIRGEWLTFLNMPAYQVAGTIALAIFVGNHIKFSAQYLKKAALFRKMF